MHSSSSSGSPAIQNSDMPKTGGVERDAGSGGTISVNGAAVNPATPKTSIPSFAAIVSSSSASRTTNSPFTSSAKTPGPTPLRRKHSSPISSGPSSSLGETSNANKSNFINSTSSTTGNGIAINTSTQSTQSTMASSAASPPCMHNNSERDTPLDNSSDEHDQEDSESSDVEICLDSFDSNNSTERMHVLSTINSVYSPCATSTKSNQMVAYLHPRSRFHLPTQTKAGYSPINEDHGTLGKFLDQENCGPESVAILGAYQNGDRYIDAHTFSPSVVTSNDGTHNGSHSALSLCSPDQVPPQPSAVHQHARSSTSGSPRETSLPEVKATTRSWLVDSGHQKQSTLMPSPSNAIAIDLANLSMNDGHLGGTACRTTANAGISHQGQMGIPVSTSQPFNSVRSSISPATLNGIFSNSASDSSWCGLADGGNGAESKNGTAFSTGNVRTPNVYINGLAPHFPEDELFNLCNEFGPIKSVRTFTRHVKDSESGYGFVLFETIDDAEKCINEIRRRYKNLHPTFSKQIHKIPGTNYSAGPSPSWNVSVTGDAISGNGNFKSKMESLHDPMSTNLYMEGLPLSIDEPTLAAIVAPHRIVSSRFFRARLGDPPRIIAFVRLETRAGAEEIIDRLHGRLVRGWNDPGSRIAVRFADTTKQRDLRKERCAQEGETSPSRLTIAEASLLNLRGQNYSFDLMQPDHTGSAFSLPSSSSSRGFATSVSAPDFSSNSLAPHGHSNFSLPNGLGRTTPGLHSLEMDYPLALGGNSAFHSRSRSPYARPLSFSLGRETFLDPSRSNSSLPHAGPRRGHENSVLNDEIEENFYSQSRGMDFPRQQLYGLPYGQHHLPISQSVDSMLGQTYARPSPAYTCSGYTPAEEYIMCAHAETAVLAQSQRQQPNGVEATLYQPRHVERGRPLPQSRLTATGAEIAPNIAVGMRAYRAQASLMSPTVSTSTSANSISSFGNAGELQMGDGVFGLPSSGVMTGEDFHAANPSASLTTSRNLHASRVSRELRTGQKSAAFSAFLPVSSSMLSLNQDHSTSPSLPAEVSPPSTVSPNPNDTILSAYQQQSASTHMRSTTLPQHRSSAVANGHIRGHHQHSSMSVPKQNIGTPQHASVARFGGSSALVEESSGTIYEYDAQGLGEKPQGEVVGARLNNSALHGNVCSSVPLKTHYSSSAIFGDAEQPSSPRSASSSLISPTLTYGGQTPSTLSPPTPFFGSFNSNAEGFDMNCAGEQQPGQKIHGGNCSRSGSH